MAEIRWLTNPEDGFDLWPCFLPDGLTVVFTRFSIHCRKSFFSPLGTRPPISALWKIGINGGKATPWGPLLKVAASRPSCRRDLPLIACSGGGRLIPWTSRIWLIDEEGVSAHPLKIKNSGLIPLFVYPSWCPEGRQLVVCSISLPPSRGGILQLIDIDKREATPLTDQNTVFAGKPSVSPVGGPIAFAGQANSGQKYDPTKNQIWLRLPNGECHPFDSGQGRAPEWSPDGKVVAFESVRGNEVGRKYAIFVKPLSGDKTARVTPFVCDAQHPFWSPDGRRIVFDGSATHKRRGIGIVEMDS
jgi:Tol biopolymer transport system component